jgi:hypothetical protein
MSEAETAASQPDPMEKMRELRDTYLETWSKYLIETVNSENYAKASGAALNNYLNVAAPLKEPTEQALLRTLEQLHIPTSVDFAGLAGRITNIEMQLDNADAKLDRIEKLLTAMQPSVAAKAAKSRTRAAGKTAAQTKVPRRAGRAAKRATTAKPGLHSARIGKK